MCGDVFPCLYHCGKEWKECLCGVLDVNNVGRNLKISNIKSGFVSSIANAMNEKLVYPSSRTELETAIQELSLRHNREVYPEQPYNSANIVENFENPKFSFGVSESSDD